MDTATTRSRIKLGSVALGAAVSLVASPAVAGEIHRVKPGQNLSGIASRYDSSVFAIAARNAISDPNLVVAGAKLRVPIGRWVDRWASRYDAPAVQAASQDGAPQEAAPAAPAGGSIEGIILDAAASHGVSGPYLVSIARCESGLDPQAVNPAGFHGLFQYDQQTWAAYGQGSIYDPVAQANTTAALIAGGQASRWPHCA